MTLESVRPSTTSGTTLESLQPLSSPIESILGNGTGWTGGTSNLDLYKLNLEWGAMDGLTIKRNYVQSRVATSGQAFSLGVQDALDESMLLTPSARTSLQYSHQRVGLQNLAARQLTGSDVSALRLSQTYGQGSSAGAFSLSRKTTESYGPNADPRGALMSLLQSVTEQNVGLTQGFTSQFGAGKLELSRAVTTTEKPNELGVTQSSDALRLSTNLWAQTAFSGAYERTESSLPTGTDTQRRSINLSRAFGPGQVSMGLSNLVSVTNGVTTETTTQTYRAPALLAGTGLQMGFDRTQVQQNGASASDSRTFSVGAARAIDGRNYTANYARTMVETPGVDTEITVQGLTAPLSVQGTAVALGFNSNTTQQNGRVVGDSRTFTGASKLNGRDVSGSWARTMGLTDGAMIENTVQGYALPLSLQGTAVALAMNTNTTQRNGAVTNDARTFTGSSRLNGRDVTGSWARTMALTDGAMIENTVQGYALPLSLRGTAVALGFNSNTTQSNGRVVGDNRSITAMSRLNNRDFGGTWTRNEAIADGAMVKTQTANYQVPLQLLGTPLNMGFTANTVQSNQAMVSDVRAFNIATRLNNQDIAGSWGRNASLQNGIYVTTKTQQGAAPLRILGTPVQVSFNTNTVQNGRTEVADNRNINVTTRLGGNDLAASWARALNPQDGAAVKVTTGRFSLPVDFLGEKLNLTYNLDARHVNNVLQSATRTLQTNLPMIARYLPGATASLAVTGYKGAGVTPQDWTTLNVATPMSIGGTRYTTDHMYRAINASTGDGHQWVTNASGPLSIFGRRVAMSGQYVEDLQPNDSGTEKLQTDFTVPFKPGNATIARQSLTSIAAGGQTSYTVRTTNLASPRVPLSTRASVQADVQMVDQASGDTRNTHLNLQANPTAPLTVSADYRLSEADRRRSLATHQIDASYALSQRLSLNTRYLEREQQDTSPLVQRQVVMQRKASGSDLSLRAALAHVDNAGADGELMHLVEMGFGEARNLALTMAYQEYNESDLARLGAPTIRVGLQHGTDNTLSWLFNYMDFAGRVEPQRQYGLGLPTGSGNLKVSLTQNPVDAADTTGATIKTMDVYDANLSQKLFGDIDLNLGYRCYDATAHANRYGNDLEQWYQLKVSGGSVEGHGQVQIAYANGEFVPRNADKPDFTPQSTLTVRYEKKWSDVGSLSLNLDRTNVPDGYADIKDSYEGRLQFNYEF